MRAKHNIPTKSTLNLALRERKAGSVRTLIIGILLIALMSAAVAKFGVIDQYARLSQAQSAYENIHKTSQKLAESLKDFDKIQADYRAHAMDWLESDTIGQLVDRQDVLELLEQELMTQGIVSSVGIYDYVMRVDMSGMSLEQISRMILSLEDRDIVAAVDLNVAATDEKEDTELLTFSLTIVLRRGGEDK